MYALKKYINTVIRKVNKIIEMKIDKTARIEE